MVFLLRCGQFQDAGGCEVIGDQIVDIFPAQGTQDGFSLFGVAGSCKAHGDFAQIFKRDAHQAFVEFHIGGLALDIEIMPADISDSLLGGDDLSGPGGRCVRPGRGCKIRVLSIPPRGWQYRIGSPSEMALLDAEILFQYFGGALSIHQEGGVEVHAFAAEFVCQVFYQGLAAVTMAGGSQYTKELDDLGVGQWGMWAGHRLRI